MSPTDLEDTLMTTDAEVSEDTHNDELSSSGSLI